MRVRYQTILLPLLIGIFICIDIHTKLPLLRILGIFVLFILHIYSTFPICKLIIDVMFILMVLLIITSLQLIKCHLYVSLLPIVVINYRRIRKLSILHKILVLLKVMLFLLRKIKEN